MPETILIHPNNPYIHSQIFAGTRRALLINEDNEGELEKRRQRLDRRYLVPYHVAELIEPRLDSLRAELWTTATTDNALVRKLLQYYFLCEYPSFPFFSKDAFLDDMIRGRINHCSPLLVNSILASACHGLAGDGARLYIGNDSTVTDRFADEAKRLWIEEREDFKLTTIQAGTILALLSFADGTDEVTWSYNAQIATLIQAMGLFSRFPATISEQQRIARAITAWGFFRWQALASFHYRRPPILHAPPLEQLPNHDRAPSYFGELFVQYPLLSDPISLDVGHTFLSEFQFSVILNELALLSRGDLDERNFDIERAARYHTLLNDWFSQLPPPLASDHVLFPHHLKLHAYYYKVILHLYTRLTPHSGDEDDLNQTAQLYQSETTSTALLDSRVKLETVLRLYFLRHGFDCWDMFLMQSVGVLAHHSLVRMASSADSANIRVEAVSTLAFCLKALYDQRQKFALADELYHRIPSLASPEDASLLRDLIEFEIEGG